MRRHFLFVGVVMILSAVLVAQAQSLGPEERYVGIYYTIQEADGLLAKGQTAQAAARYREAQTGLKELQTAYPGWNERVLKFRTEYVANKLEPIASALATNQPPAVTTPAGTTPAVAAPQTAPFEGTAKDLQEQISRLTAQNAEMQAKLKEALSVQPAAVDPKELGKAEEKIKQLEKERDLLKVSLEQSKTAKPEDPTPAGQEQKILEEVRQKLAQQTELATSLQKENELLKGQLAVLKTTPGSGSSNELAQELQVSRLMLLTLQETNVALRTDALIKEKQLEELSKNAVSKSLYATVVKERDDLKQQLLLGSRKGFTGSNRDELARQLEAAQAKLAAFEAKPIPYTPEELALTKGSDMRVTISDATLRKKKVPEMPAGTAPIMESAMLDMDNRKFPEAEKKFLDVLRQDERNLYVLNHVIEAQIEQNHFEDANKNLQKSLGIDPQDSATLFLKGRLRFYEQKYDDAFEALSLSAKIDPDKFQTQYWLGKVLIQKGHRAAAETALRKSVQLQPRWGHAHYLLAFIYINQQPPYRELAQWHYREALRNGYAPNTEFEKLLEEKKAPAADTK